MFTTVSGGVDPDVLRRTRQALWSDGGCEPSRQTEGASRELDLV